MKYVNALSLIFFLVNNPCFSQGYKPILADSCTWYFTNHYFGFDSDGYYVSKDTVLAGNSYKILDGFHFNGNAFLREDTVSRKFYYRQIGGFRANQDILIYDFSLAVGDSMLLFNPNTPVDDSVGYFTLDSIATRTIKSGTTRMFYLSGPKDGTGMKARAEWMEGVGSTLLINSGGAVGDLYNQGELTCFFRGNEHVYESALSAEFGFCDINTVGVDEQAERFEPIAYPNPFGDRIFIRAGSGHIRLQLYSVFGELILDKVINAEQEVVDVSDLKTGTYVALFVSGHKTSRRIMIKK